MNKYIYIFVFFSIISGILSLLSFSAGFGQGFSAKILGYGPGFIFGITISTLLYFFYKKNIILHILYIFISVVAFYASVQAFSVFMNENDDMKGFLLAGFVGSFILAVYLKLMYRLSFKYLVIIVVVGSVAGTIHPDLFRIFTLWQPAVALAIYYGVAERKTLEG